MNHPYDFARKARGGKRIGAGRKPLWQTKRCTWVIERIRQIGESAEFMQRRQQQFIKRHYPNHTENNLELLDNYKKLAEATTSQRRTMIADDVISPLEETRQIIASSGFPQYLKLPPPNQFEMNEIYRKVASEAAAKFGTPFTVRKIKDYVQAWRAFELSIKESP